MRSAFSRFVVFFYILIFVVGGGCADNSTVDTSTHEGKFTSLTNGTKATDQSVYAWIPRASQITNGVHYEGEGEETLTWGAKNFTIDEDGTFWIADTAGEQIIHTERDGVIIEAFDVSSDAVGAYMAAVNNTEMAVVSVASQPPRVLRYSRSGELVATYDLPMEWQGSVTGIEINEDGTIIVQREHNYRRYSIQTNEDGGHQFKTESGRTWDTTEPTPFGRFIVRPVDDRNTMSLRRFMTKEDDLVYIYAEEWRDDEYGQAVVDATVRKFDWNAEQIAIARIPIRDRYTFVDLGGVQYDQASGNVLAMMTKPNGLAIVSLDFVDCLDPLPEWGKPDEVEESEGDSAADEIPIMCATCVSGSTMVSRAGLLTTTVVLNYTKNIANDSSCTRRTVPRYLGSSSGFYNGVPYSWGDWDTWSQFSSYMSSASTYKAGDIWTTTDQVETSPTSCGRGTDCSGLVSQAWGFSSKISTTNIASSAYTNSDTGSWDQGEVYNKSGSHVIMYYGVSSGPTYYWYEATIDSSYDRALMTTRPTSYYSGYTHRRYINQCS